MRPHVGVRGGLPAALTVAENDPDQKAGRRRSRSSPVRGDPSSRLRKAERAGVDGRSVLFVRQSGPRSTGVEQLPIVHARVEHPRQSDVRYGGHRSVAGARPGGPRYNEFRRKLGLSPIDTFADLTDDQERVRKLDQVYDDVEQLDLTIATLAEGHRPAGLDSARRCFGFSF